MLESVQGPTARNESLEGVMTKATAKVVFIGLLLGNGLGQSKAVPVGHPKPTIPLFRAVVTVMVKWLYIQQMTIWSYLPTCFE